MDEEILEQNERERNELVVDKNVEKIIFELVQNRSEMYRRLNEITKRRERMEKELTTSVDYRKKWYNIELQKLIYQNTEIELKLLEKIDSSLKTEFEIRKKIVEKETSEFSKEKIELISNIIKSNMLEQI